MGELVTRRTPRRSNKLAWIVTSLFLLAALVAGGFVIAGATHAAGPLDGHYALRAATTSGPQSGLYIRGSLNITVSNGKVSGIASGLSYAPSRSLTITGTSSDSTHATFTIAQSQSPKFPAVTFTGVFQTATNVKGSYTGFLGTFTIGSGVGASSGHWQGFTGVVPPTTGTWNTSILVQAGKDKGASYHGVLTLVQDANNKIVGTYTPTGGTALAVKGYNQNSFVFLDLGAPATFVLKGTFSSSTRLDGQFYMPGTGSGKDNDRGYFVANQAQN